MTGARVFWRAFALSFALMLAPILFLGLAQPAAAPSPVRELEEPEPSFRLLVRCAPSQGEARWTLLAFSPARSQVSAAPLPGGLLTQGEAGLVTLERLWRLGGMAAAAGGLSRTLGGEVGLWLSLERSGFIRCVNTLGAVQLTLPEGPQQLDGARSWDWLFSENGAAPAARGDYASALLGQKLELLPGAPGQRFAAAAAGQGQTNLSAAVYEARLPALRQLAALDPSQIGTLTPTGQRTSAGDFLPDVQALAALSALCAEG